MTSSTAETTDEALRLLREWEVATIKLDKEVTRAPHAEVPPPRRKFFVNEKTGARSEHNGEDKEETASVTPAAVAAAAARSVRIPGWDYKSWDNFDVVKRISQSAHTCKFY